MSLEGREEPEEQTDIDRRFAEIVAQLEPQEADWDEAVTPAPSTDADAGADEDDDVESATPEPSPLAGLPSQWRMPPSGSASMLDDDEADVFVPAPPQPLPSGDDMGFWAMVGCLVGGPAWLLYLFFFDRYAPSLWWVLACALFVAGVVQLFMRSPKNRDDDDDDGAVL
jgi:hypothetical protein